MIEPKTYKAPRTEYEIRDFAWDAKKKTLILGDVHVYGYCPEFVIVTGVRHKVYFEHKKDDETAQVAMYFCPTDVNKNKDVDFDIKVLIPWVRK